MGLSRQKALLLAMMGILLLLFFVAAGLMVIIWSNSQPPPGREQSSRLDSPPLEAVIPEAALAPPRPRPTEAPTATPNVPATPEPTDTPHPTESPTPIPTDTPSPATASPTPTDSPEPTTEPAPTEEPTATPVPTESPLPTPEPTPSPEPTPDATPSPEPSLSPSPTPQPSPSPRPTTMVLTMAPSPVPDTFAQIPEHGKTWSNLKGTAIAPFEVRNTGDVYTLIMLTLATDAERSLSIFLHPGESAVLVVPYGEYTVKAAWGDAWQGAAELFGPETQFGIAGETLVFERTESGVTSHQVDLGAPLQGSMTFQSIQRSDW